MTFNGVDAGPASSWADRQIRVSVPAGAASGSVVVTVGGTASNPFAFTVNHVILAPEAVPIDESVSVADLTEDQVVYTNNGAVPVLQPGDVIFGAYEDGGYMRKVTDVQVTPESVVVSTEPASLAEAFDEAEISLRIPLFPEGGAERQAAADLEFGVVGNFHPPLGEYVDAQATVGLTVDFNLDLDLSIRNRELEMFEISTKGTVYTNAELIVLIPIAGYSEELTANLPVLYQHRFFALISGIPFWVKVEVQPLMGVDLSFDAEASLATGYEMSVSNELGGRYENGSFSPIAVYQDEMEVTTPTWQIEGTGSARGYVALALRVVLYDLVGPEIRAEPYLEGNLHAQLNPPDCGIGIDVGMRSELSLDFGVLDKYLASVISPIQAELFDFNRTLYETDLCPSAGESLLPDTGQNLCCDNTTAIECPSPGQPFYGQDAQYVTNPMSYTVSPDGLTVTDNVTGLMWQRADDDIARTWADAISYCEGLALGGHTDWRLPNEYELQSIVHYGLYNPAIDTTVFPGTIAGGYWSSSTPASYTSYAWYVYFGNGYVYSNDKTDTYYVRCVR